MHNMWMSTLDNAPRIIELSEGWRLIRADLAPGDGAWMSTNEVRDGAVAVSRMPSTVLRALADAGVYPDIYIADHLAKVDPDLWRHDWWYQRTLDVPAGHSRYTLRFDGINYRAEIWLNGTLVAGPDEIVGMIRTYELDVSGIVRPGGENVLAVRVVPERRTPGLVLGDSGRTADPAGVDLSDTWADWLNFAYCGDSQARASFVPDKNAGLWRRVYLSFGGPVALRHPYVRTELPLPRLDEATLTVYVDAVNHSDAAVTGTLRGVIAREGKPQIRFHKKVELGAREEREIVVTAADAADLVVADPDLWWPYVWGEPNLYRLETGFDIDGELSDTAGIDFGIRQITQHRDDTAFFPEFDDPGSFYLKVNGRDYLVRGAAYGPDLLLGGDRERARTIMRYAKDLGVNLIRWEGKFVDDGMLELADREGMPTMHGLMCCGSWEQWSLWNEEDHRVARATVASVARRLRAHASSFLWSNGSDGLPPDEVLADYRRAFEDAHWQNAIVDTVSARFRDWSGIHMIGPYSWRAPALWFDPEIPNHRGSVAEEGNDETIPTLESLRKFIPEDKLWPINEVWEMHGAAVPAQSRLEGTRGAIERRYGPVSGVEDLARKAQVAQYENVRAQFEAYGARGWETHKFTVYWMLNSHWPSFFGHLFDHYFKQGGGYFGAKKALRPVGVVFDSYGVGDRSQARVYLVNHGTQALLDTRVRARVYDLDGALIDETTASVASAEPHSAAVVLSLPRYEALAPAFFVRLTAHDAEGTLLAENSYWQSTIDDLPVDQASTSILDAMYVKQSQWADLSALDRLPQVTLGSSVTELSMGAGTRRFRITLENPSPHIAFFVRATLCPAPREDEILPIRYDDNYVTIYPGETRVLEAEIDACLVEGIDPVIEIEGYNLARSHGGRP